MSEKSLIKEITMEYIKSFPVYDEIKKYMEMVGQLQEAICIASSGNDDKTMLLIRIGTVLSLSIAGKMGTNGKMPEEFEREDWEDIAQAVLEYGVLMDGEKYTEFVFELYARYIEKCVEINKKELSISAQEEIKALADELRDLTRSLNKGQFSEADYVDRCLWVCFEAMIKLWASYGSGLLPEKLKKYGDLIPATADYAVQYARLKMYSKEKAILEEYLNNQEILTNELQAKLDVYIAELSGVSEQFNNLIKDAFDPNFRDKLMASVNLAKAAGVDEEIILDSEDKIDEFFN